MTKKYELSEVDQFNASDYPEIMAELAIMRKDMHHAPVYYRGEIAISYFRDHCLLHQWTIANPELTRLITTGTYKSANIEALFTACRRLPLFLAAYETYLHHMLTDDSTYFVSHEQ